MQPRLDVLTVGVTDIAATRAFYVDGLGWKPALEIPDEIIFLQLNHGLLVSFWGADKLAADMGLPPGSVTPGTGFTLAHNPASPEEVADVLAVAEAAGGTILKPATKADFGGTHGYFADPDGIRWEIAYNPGLTVGADGKVEIREIT